ncbi:MAG: cyclic pyranopterin monophosphate synthase MoaC [Acidobacteria bacterium]|nr:cyclic pyranopterin monophosphate synthase MoaC [Acidobacteriota bacterium]
MGTPKQHLMLDGRSFLRRTVDAAREAFDEVVIVNRSGDEEIAGVRTIRDDHDGAAAAIFGIREALRDSDELRTWILAVDYPLMSSEVLEDQRRRFESSFAELWVPAVDGRPHMLCAGWTRTLIRSIDQAIRSEQYTLRAFLDQGRTEICEITDPHWRKAFMNVNTRDDLENLSDERGGNGDDAPKLSHLDESGSVRMVDVGAKAVTRREAEAEAIVRLGERAFEAVRTNALPKGDAIATARIAAIMAAKKTSELIPMTHPLAIDGVDISIEPDEESSSFVIRATVRCEGKTGVEMEALTACAVAALTLVDMCKSADKGIEIERIRLTRKSGGKSGEWVRSRDQGNEKSEE